MGAVGAGISMKDYTPPSTPSKPSPSPPSDVSTAMGATGPGIDIKPSPPTPSPPTTTTPSKPSGGPPITGLPTISQPTKPSDKTKFSTIPGTPFNQIEQALINKGNASAAFLLYQTRTGNKAPDIITPPPTTTTEETVLSTYTLPSGAKMETVRLASGAVISREVKETTPTKTTTPSKPTETTGSAFMNLKNKFEKLGIGLPVPGPVTPIKPEPTPITVSETDIKKANLTYDYAIKNLPNYIKEYQNATTDRDRAEWRGIISQTIFSADQAAAYLNKGTIKAGDLSTQVPGADTVLSDARLTYTGRVASGGIKSSDWRAATTARENIQKNIETIKNSDKNSKWSIEGKEYTRQEALDYLQNAYNEIKITMTTDKGKDITFIPGEMSYSDFLNKARDVYIESMASEFEKPEPTIYYVSDLTNQFFTEKEYQALSPNQKKDLMLTKKTIQVSNADWNKIISDYKTGKIGLAGVNARVAQELIDEQVTLLTNCRPARYGSGNGIISNADYSAVMRDLVTGKITQTQATTKLENMLATNLRKAYEGNNAVWELWERQNPMFVNPDVDKKVAKYKKALNFVKDVANESKSPINMDEKRAWQDITGTGRTGNLTAAEAQEWLRTHDNVSEYKTNLEEDYKKKGKYFVPFDTLKSKTGERALEIKVNKQGQLETTMDYAKAEKEAWAQMTPLQQFSKTFVTSVTQFPKTIYSFAQETGYALLGDTEQVVKTHKRLESDVIKGGYDIEQAVQKGKRGEGYGEYAKTIALSPAMTDVVYPFAIGAGFSAAFSAVGRAAVTASKAGSIWATPLKLYATKAPWVFTGIMSGAVGAEIKYTAAMEQKGQLPEGSTANLLSRLGMQFTMAGLGAKWANEIYPSTIAEIQGNHGKLKGMKKVPDPYKFKNMTKAEMKKVLLRETAKMKVPGEVQEGFGIGSNISPKYRQQYEILMNAYKAYSGEPAPVGSSLRQSISEFSSKIKTKFSTVGRKTTIPKELRLTEWTPQKEFTVKSYVDELVHGTLRSSPEQSQFYKNNAKKIEAALRRVREGKYKPVKYFEPQNIEMQPKPFAIGKSLLPPGQYPTIGRRAITLSALELYKSPLYRKPSIKTIQKAKAEEIQLQKTRFKTQKQLERMFIEGQPKSLSLQTKLGILRTKAFGQESLWGSAREKINLPKIGRPIGIRKMTFGPELEKVPVESIPEKYLEKGIGRMAKPKSKVEEVGLERDKWGRVKFVTKEKPFYTTIEEKPKITKPFIEEFRAWGKEVTPKQYAKYKEMKVRIPRKGSDIKFNKEGIQTVAPKGSGLNAIWSDKTGKTWASLGYYNPETDAIYISPYLPKSTIISQRQNLKEAIKGVKSWLEEIFEVEQGRPPTKKELDIKYKEFLKINPDFYKIKLKEFFTKSSVLEHEIEHSLSFREKGLAGKLEGDVYKGLETYYKNKFGVEKFNKMIAKEQSLLKKVYKGDTVTKDAAKKSLLHNLEENHVIGLQKTRFTDIKKPYVIPTTKRAYPAWFTERPRLFKGPGALLKQLTIEEVTKIDNLVSKYKSGDEDFVKEVNTKANKILKKNPKLSKKEAIISVLEDMSTKEIKLIGRAKPYKATPGWTKLGEPVLETKQMINEYISKKLGLERLEVMKDLPLTELEISRPLERPPGAFALGAKDISPRIKNLMERRFTGPSELTVLESELIDLRLRINKLLEQDRYYQNLALNKVITKNEMQKSLKPIHDEWSKLKLREGKIISKIKSIPKETGFRIIETQPAVISKKANVLDKLIAEHEAKLAPKLKTQAKRTEFLDKIDNDFMSKQAKAASELGVKTTFKLGEKYYPIPKEQIQTFTDVDLKDLSFYEGMGTYLKSDITEFIQRVYNPKTNEREFIGATGVMTKIIPDMPHPLHEETRTVIEWLRPSKIKPRLIKLLKQTPNQLKDSGQLKVLGRDFPISKYQNIEIKDIPVTLRDGDSLDIGRLSAHVIDIQMGSNKDILVIGTTHNINLKSYPHSNLRKLSKQDAEAIINRIGDELALGKEIKPYYEYDKELVLRERERLQDIIKAKQYFQPEKVRIPTAKELIMEQKNIFKMGREYKSFALEHQELVSTKGQEEPVYYKGLSELKGEVSSKLKSYAEMVEAQGIKPGMKKVWYGRAFAEIQRGRPLRGHGSFRVKEQYALGEPGVEETVHRLKMISEMEQKYRPPSIILETKGLKVATPVIPKETGPKILRGSAIQEKLLIPGKQYQIVKTAEGLHIQFKPKGKIEMGLKPPKEESRIVKVITNLGERKLAKIIYETYGISKEEFEIAYEKAMREIQENKVIEREIQQQINRQVGKQNEKQISRQASRNISREISKQIGRHLVKVLPKQIEEQIEEQISRQISRQVSRQIQKQIPRQVTKQIPRIVPTFVPSFVPQIVPPKEPIINIVTPTLPLIKYKQKAPRIRITPIMYYPTPKKKKEIKQGRRYILKKYKEREFIIPTYERAFRAGLKTKYHKQFNLPKANGRYRPPKKIEL